MVFEKAVAYLDVIFTQMGGYLYLRNYMNESHKLQLTLLFSMLILCSAV